LANDHEAESMILSAQRRFGCLPWDKVTSRWLILTAVPLFLAACGNAQNGGPASNQSGQSSLLDADRSVQASAADHDGKAGPAPDDARTYVIGAGDTLFVYVNDAPQLTAEVPVRPDGRISTPLIPEIVAAGKTPGQLARDLTQRLKQYVSDPNVTVIVRGFVGPLSRQVRVIGEAAEPQAIPYRDHMTVLDVMIMTKGLTRYAAGNRAVIVRQGSNGQQEIRVHLSDLLKDGDISQNVELQPGDTLIIPEAWF
jgi:polysaccharide biosynthesis/export protein